MAKTVLTKEQYDLLISTYKDKRTYAAAARAVGISAAVATRIIKEYLEGHDADEEETASGAPLQYNGPAPKANPDFEDVYYCFWSSMKEKTND